MRQSQPENWDRIALKYAYYGKVKKITNHPLQSINFPKGLVLESGCGNGQIVTYLAHLGNQVVGIDFSRVMLRHCKENTADLLGVDFLLADTRYLPFRDNCFMTSFSLGVIEHFPEHELAINELCRVSSTVVISVPYLYSFFHLFMKVAQLIGMSEIGFEDAFSIDYIRKSLLNKHFRLIEILKIGRVGNVETSKLKRFVINISDILDAPFIRFNLFGWHFIYYFAERQNQ